MRLLSPFGAYGRQLMRRFDFPGADIWAEEGTSVTFGGMTATYYSTPGHTPGSCVIRLDDAVLFTGDTLVPRKLRKNRSAGRKLE